MKSLKRVFKERSLRRSIIYFLTFSLILNTSLPGVMALEVTDVISSTGAVPTQWGDHTIIDTQHGAIIDWSNFNTSSTQSVTFNQYMGSVQDGASAVLNRISSGSVPTAFNGVLNANGRVFIVNPAGIVFGAGSTVNVTQLVASGLNMSNGAFQAVLADDGNPMVFEGGAGQVENYGSINASSVQLVGKKIINMGTIAAPDGLVVMAAGDNVYLAQNGSNVFVELNEGSTSRADSIINEGSVEVGSGKIVLAAGDSFSSAITEGDNMAASSSADSKDIETDEDSDSDGSSQIAISCYTKPTPKQKPKDCPNKDDGKDNEGNNGCGGGDDGDNGGGDNGDGDNGGGDNGGGDNGGGDNGGGDNGGGDNGGGDNGGGDNGGGDNGGGDNGGGDNGGGDNGGGDNGGGDNGDGDSGGGDDNGGDNGGGVDDGTIHGSVAVFMKSAPVPEIELEYAGCPALMKWAADELGIDERMMQIWTSSAMASTQDIQPCNSCARLKATATILRDADGTHTAALSKVISEYASRTAPPSPEEMTMIASAIADNSDSDSRYAKARVYLDALSAYVSTLNSEMHFSIEESVLFAADRYVAPLAEESQNDAVVAFIATRLASMAGSGS